MNHGAGCASGGVGAKGNPPGGGANGDERVTENRHAGGGTSDGKVTAAGAALSVSRQGCAEGWDYGGSRASESQSACPCVGGRGGRPRTSPPLHRHSLSEDHVFVMRFQRRCACLKLRQAVARVCVAWQPTARGSDGGGDMLRRRRRRHSSAAAAAAARRRVTCDTACDKKSRDM